MSGSPQQARLAVEIASRMSATPPVQLDLILKKLEVEGLEPKVFDPWDQEALVHDFVATLSSDVVERIANYYGINSPSNSPKVEAARVSNDLPVMFVSFDSADKVIAGEITTVLNNLGVSTFLAHRDIAGGTNWRTELMNQLNRSAAMICIIGENYHSKPICSQEIGWAWSRGIPIVPCSVHSSVDPARMGFISEIQFIFHAGSSVSTASEILGNLVNNNPVSERITDSLLAHLEASTNFDMALKRWLPVASVEKLSLSQVDTLARILEENYQVKNANYGRLEPVVRAKIVGWADAAEK